MKKLISVFLAVAMIFTVCAMSVSAEAISTYDNEYFYYTGKIKAEGTLEYFPATNSVKLYVYCTNNEYDSVSEFHLFAQCAVNYSDGSQDFFTISNRMFLAPIEPVRYVFDTFYLPANKTIESFDAEFFIWYENDTLWEGQIYEPLA